LGEYENNKLKDLKDKENFSKEEDNQFLGLNIRLGI